MLKELSWYIENDRFTGIVEEIESKAQQYSQALLTGTAIEDAREEFRRICQWHVEKSGYKTSKDSFINPDLEFFDGANINREALNTFEKEIIKAHMYQKHLWEFMGTTGCMTIISQSAMKEDGFVYEQYLPLSYSKNRKEKSPIENILKENPGTVPVYIYPDGSVSNEYHRDKAKIRFDILKDKSGFDWSRKGWDPNYEVEKTDWHGEYDENNSWVMVKEKNESEKQTSLPGAKLERIPVIEIIKDENETILYDPGYSLISVFEKIYLLADGEIYGAEQTDIDETVKIIKTAMEEIGAKKIDIIAGRKEIIRRTDKKSRKENRDGKTIGLYKKLFGEYLSEEVKIKTTKEIQEIKKKIINKTHKDQIKDKGQYLLQKIQVAYESGLKGEQLLKTLRTNTMQVPLSIYNKVDCINAGLSEENYRVLQNYYVPENKQQLFSNVILNLLLEEKMLMTSGKTLEELFDTVYRNIVQEKEIDEVISIETTFEELCKNPAKIITAEQVEETTLQALKNAKNELPEQSTIEKQKLVDEAVNNVIRNFSAIRMSTGMTPVEAVKLAAKTVGGKNGETFVPPVSGIVYSTPGMNGSLGSGKEKRIFSDISLKDMIEKAKNTPPQTKEVEFKLDEEALLKNGNYNETVQIVKLDLSKRNDLSSFLETQEVMGAEIDKNLIMEYVSSVKESYPAKKMLLLNTILFNDYIKKNTIKTKEDVKELFKLSEISTRTRQVKIPNIFNKTDREIWYKTENFEKYGIPKGQLEQIILEEQEKTEKDIQSVRITKEYSKPQELEKQYGVKEEDTTINNYKIAQVEMVTKIKPVDKVIEELKSRDISKQNVSANITESINTRQSTYIPARIKADGKINRKILGTVSGNELVAEKNNLMNILSPVSEAKTPGRSNIPDMIKQQIAEQIHGPQADFMQNTHIQNEYSAVDLLQSKSGPSQGNIRETPQTGTAEYSINDKKLRTYTKTEPTPEEIRMAKINANYEHDKTVLAKEDPMFAKNKFWDTGHAEGSGEISNKEREKIKNEKLQTKIEKLLGDIDG